MAKLHVIYDRDGRLQNNLPPDKFKVAIIDIENDFGDDQIEAYVNLLSELLLEQMATTKS
jgi:hypothetical protein